MSDSHRARRLWIVGTSGSGKSRLAAEAARVTGLPRLELDEVFWDAGWQHRDVEEARELVQRFVAARPDGWIIDGNWTNRLDGMLDPPHGSDAVVWLDHPRRVVMARVVRRTLRRGILREELWHGNRERPSSWLRPVPEENILAWAWTSHPVVRERMSGRIAEGWPVVRLSGQRAADAWLADLARQEGAESPGQA